MVLSTYFSVNCLILKRKTIYKVARSLGHIAISSESSTHFYRSGFDINICDKLHIVVVLFD